MQCDAMLCDAMRCDTMRLWRFGGSFQAKRLARAAAAAQDGESATVGMWMRQTLTPDTLL